MMSSKATDQQKKLAQHTPQPSSYKDIAITHQNIVLTSLRFAKTEIDGESQWVAAATEFANVLTHITNQGAMTSRTFPRAGVVHRECIKFQYGQRCKPLSAVDACQYLSHLTKKYENNSPIIANAMQIFKQLLITKTDGSTTIAMWRLKPSIKSIALPHSVPWPIGKKKSGVAIRENESKISHSATITALSQSDIDAAILQLSPFLSKSINTKTAPKSKKKKKPAVAASIHKHKAIPITNKTNETNTTLTSLEDKNSSDTETLNDNLIDGLENDEWQKDSSRLIMPKSESSHSAIGSQLSAATGASTHVLKSASLADEPESLQENPSFTLSSSGKYSKKLKNSTYITITDKEIEVKYLRYTKTEIDGESQWVIAGTDFANILTHLPNKCAIASRTFPQAGIIYRKMINFGFGTPCKPLTAVDACQYLSYMTMKYKDDTPFITNAIQLFMQLLITTTNDSITTATWRDLAGIKSIALPHSVPWLSKKGNSSATINKNKSSKILDSNSHVTSMEIESKTNHSVTDTLSASVIDAAILQLSCFLVMRKKIKITPKEQKIAPRDPKKQRLLSNFSRTMKTSAVAASIYKHKAIPIANEPKETSTTLMNLEVKNSSDTKSLSDNHIDGFEYNDELLNDNSGKFNEWQDVPLPLTMPESESSHPAIENQLPASLSDEPNSPQKNPPFTLSLNRSSFFHFGTSSNSHDRISDAQVEAFLNPSAFPPSADEIPIPSDDFFFNSNPETMFDVSDGIESAGKEDNFLNTSTALPSSHNPGKRKLYDEDKDDKEESPHKRHKR